MGKRDAPDAHPFAPLSDEEARRERADTEEAWEPILPAPEEPPDAPQIKHRKHGPATARWIYRDATGAPLFAAARFNLPNGDKQVLPFTYGRRAWTTKSGNRQDKTGWHFKRPNPPVPLYGLDRLAARPQASVLVTEGEKKADAAEKLFPAIVAVTSQGGAGSAANGDWSALNGREVTIWPDRDTAGDGYATDVARLAQQASVESVRVVVVPQDWPDGWDLADEPPEGVTREQLALMHSEARLPNDVMIPPGFAMSASGLYFRPDPTDTPVFVAAPFDVIGEANDGAGIAWGLVIQWLDRDGRSHEWSCPKRLVHGDGNAIAAELEDAGLHCGTSRAAHEHLKHFIGAVRTSQRLRCVDSTGWHVTDRGPAFVLPGGETFGPGAGSVILQSDRMGSYDAFRSAGTLEGWQDVVARCAVANDRLVLYISARFAAPLLDVVREPGGGLHLFGDSQIGKTIALRLAASVWGPADPSGQLRDWRATSNGLEGLAAESNDVGLCLDELGQANGGDAADAAYMLANGGGKSRAARDGSVRQRRRWRNIVLSTGEMPLDVKIAEAGRRAMAGQDVRLVSLRGDAGVGLGIFQDTHGMKDAGTFARHLQDTTQAHFGTAGRAFLTKLTAERGSDPEGLVEAVKVMRDAFVASHLPCGADGQVRSVCARFGVVAAAGELARVFGIVLWPEGEATRASAACFKSWLADRGGSGAAEDVKAMRQVRAFIAAHDTSRFEEISDDSGPPSDLRTFNRAGFRRRGPNGWTYLIFPEVWRDDVCRGLDHQRTAKLLTSRNLLTPDADGRPDRKESVPTHGRPRFFVVVGTILEASDE